jgi:hypothetical protein
VNLITVATGTCRYYHDWEFIEDGRTIDPISVGLVREDGAEYYAEFDDVPWERANQWVLDNVRPHLLGGEWVRSRAQITADLLDFVRQDQRKSEIWAWYGAYDWVALCQLYGPMVGLPEELPKHFKELKQLADDLGDPRIPPQRGIAHHALADARHNRFRHQWLIQYRTERSENPT